MVELGFDPQSNVGLLFGDMRSEYVKRGGMEADFVAEANSGSTTSTFVRFTANDPLKIEIPEVFRMAYEHREYHPYLVKHGFPLPIGMNDYDPATRADDEMRAEIDRLVDTSIGEVKAQGLAPGTREYVIAVSKKLYDWGIARLHFRQCMDGSSDWEAMKNGCGVCKDMAAIMHYAFERAGLQPKYVFAAKHEPTLDNYGRFRWSTIASGQKIFPDHVCTGVPLPGSDTLLHIDIAQKKFDGRYALGTVISPAEIAIQFLHDGFQQHLAAGRLERALAIADQCLNINDNEHNCHTMKYSALWNAVWKGITGLDGEFAEWTAVLGRKSVENPSLAITFRSLSLFSAVENAVRDGDIDAISAAAGRLRAALNHFKQNNADIFPDLAYQAANSIRQIPEGLSKVPPQSPLNVELLQKQVNRMAFELAGEALMGDPRRMTAHGLLEHLGERVGGAEMLYTFYGAFTKKHPDAPLGHYQHARYGFEYSKTLTVEAAKPVLEEVGKSLAAMERLEPGSDAGRYLNAALELHRGNTDGAIALLEAERGSDRSGFALDNSVLLWQAYLIKGQRQKATGEVRRILTAEPQAARKHLLGIAKILAASLIQPPAAGNAKRSGRTNLSGSEIAAFFGQMLDMIAEDAAFLDEAKPLYGAFYTAILLSDGSAPERFLKKLGSPAPDGAKSAMDLMAGRVAGASVAAPIDNFTGNRTSTWARAEKLGTILKPTSAYPGYARVLVAFSRQAIARRDLPEATRLAKRAFESPSAAQLFLDIVAKDLFSASFSEPASAARRRMVLDAVEVSLVAAGDDATALLSAEKGGLESMLAKCADLECPAAETTRVERLLKRLREKTAP